MLLFNGALGLFMIGLWIFCVIDVITTPEDRCRNLPKIAWVLIVIVLIEIGAIAWLVAGRRWDPKQPDARERPTRRAPLAPDDDEEFLAGLKARAEEQRRRARDASEGDGAPEGPAN